MVDDSEDYKKLEKVADEMLVTIKAVISQSQQIQANQSLMIAQLSNYVNKIESEKNKSEQPKSETINPVG